MEKNNTVNIAQSLVEELFNLIGFTPEINVSQVSPKTETEEEVIQININSPKEAGLLIGSRGTTLSAIQSFLSLSLRQKLGEWVRVMVDVGDWREKHEEYLKDLAKQASERARSTGDAQHLYNLTPSQRRVIHVYLQEEDGIITESEGEGMERYLVVKAK